MRIGEIAIIAPHAPTKREFIRNVCDEIIVQTDDLIFGRLQVNNQLMLHLYGLNYVSHNLSPSWDLVSQKLLGYIVLFNWTNPNSLESVKKMLDALTLQESTPVVVAANVSRGDETIPVEFLNIDMNLSSSCEFTFCDAHDKEGARNTLVILLDSILEKMD